MYSWAQNISNVFQVKRKLKNLKTMSREDSFGQYNISGPCEASQILQSVVPETLKGLTTKNKTGRIHVGMLQYQN